MIRGLYTSAIGMGIQQKRLDATSNNLANADTAAFRRDVVVTQAFSDVLALRVRDYEMRGFGVVGNMNLGPMSLGATINTVHRDFTMGQLTPTGTPFGLALDNQGFFMINHVSMAGTETLMFTRDGSFTLNVDGYLVTMGGFLVLDEDGEAINIPNGEVTIHPNGQIEIEGSMIATLGLANFESLADMRPFGHNLYTAIPEAIPTAFNGNVLQGVRESSNVNVVQEMVNMITISRAYEANARMISIQDETLQQAVNNIARM
ncbi:MAG: flagellar hook-basal body protein [Defluviitaleaceae bacterium]|nr:flagellar hook-basal body protein [Defluviitaleaceae bacterium]